MIIIAEAQITGAQILQQRGAMSFRHRMRLTARRPKAYGTLLVALAVCCFCLQHGAAAMKVIGLGAGRTGTESLKAALEELGFGPTYHMVMRQNRFCLLLVAKAVLPCDCWSFLMR